MSEWFTLTLHPDDYRFPAIHGPRPFWQWCLIVADYLLAPIVFFAVYALLFVR